MRLRTLPTLFFAMGIPTLVFAQEPGPSASEVTPAGPVEPYDGTPSVETTDEQSLSVTTTTRAPQKSFTSDRATNIVTEEELRRRQPVNTTDALDEEAGIFIQSTNRGAGTVIMRGQIGAENLIYVDGVRFNQSTFRTGPIQYLNTLDPWAMERIEVVRGPGSVLYGSDALGGVIQLFPGQVHDTSGTKIETRTTFNSADLTYGAGVDAATRADRFGAQLGGAFRSHHDLRPGSVGGEDIVASSLSGSHLEQSDYDEFFFRGGITYDLTARNTLRMNYMGGLVDDAPRVDRLGQGEVRLYRNRDDLLWATYEFDGNGLWDQIRYNVSIHRSREDVERSNCFRVDGVAPDPVGCAILASEHVEKQRLNVDETYTLGTSLSVSSHVEDWRLRVNWGADAYGDFVSGSTRTDYASPDFEANPRERGNFAQDSTYSRFGVYAYLEQSPFAPAENELLVRAGARFDANTAFAPDVSPELGDVEYDHVGVVGTAGVTWLYSTMSNVYLNWSQGFRSPNLQETTVLGDTGNFFEIPNDELGPERSDTFELGNKLDIKNIVRATSAAWVSLMSDKITRDPADYGGATEIDGKPVQQRVNTETAYFYGAEIDLKTYPVFDTHLHGTFTYTDGGLEASAPDDTFVEGPLHSAIAGDVDYENPRRLPPIFWTAGATYSPSKTWYATVFARGSAAQDKVAPGDQSDLRICEAQSGVLFADLDQECSGSSAWTTLNLRGGYATSLARVDLALENVFDQRYRYHGSGLLAPGINAMVTVTLFNR